MNDTEIIWTKELIEKVNENSLGEIINWIGIEYDLQYDDSGNRIHFVKPYDKNIEKVIINVDGFGVIDRIGIFGINFYFPFDFILSMFKDYKRTFNTYDPIEDEQFIFYPTQTTGKLHAADSWISTEHQKKDLAAIRFNYINFYFSKNKIPYHFRDGWHLIDPKTYPL